MLHINAQVMFLSHSARDSTICLTKYHLHVDVVLACLYASGISEQVTINEAVITVRS